MNKQRYHYVPLKYVASDIKDGTHGTHKRAISGVPFLSAKNVTSTGRILWNEKDDCISENDYSAITSSFAPKQGDLLITVVGTLGRTALFEGSRVAFQRSVAFVRPNSNIVSDYLLQASKDANFIRQMERRSNATAQAGLYLGELAKIKIPLPTLEQQRLIAKILSTIDRTIAKTEALIEKYQQIKAGLMHDLFTRGIGADGKLRSPREVAPELYKNSAIGWIPKEWDLTKLSKVLARIESGWSPACPEASPSIGEWGVLKVSAVTKGFYDCSESKVLPNNLKPIPSLEVRNKDVIMTRANGAAELVGKCVQISKTQQKLMLSDKLLRLCPISKMITNDYLGSLMCSEQIKKQITRSMNGSSGQRNISQTDIRKFVCAIPSTDEQKAISDRLLKHQKFIMEEYRFLKKLIQQKSGLMHDLLTGKVSVNVDSAP